MPLPVEDRDGLARQQGALLRSLTGLGPAPEGFDLDRIREASAAIFRKRARAARRACPKLADALGEGCDDAFASFAAMQPLPRLGGAIADGRAFARWAARRQRLPDAARLEAMGIDLRHAACPGGLVPRRRPSTAWLLLREPRRLVLAAAWPGGPVRSIAIPMGPRRHAPSEPDAVIVGRQPRASPR